MDGLRKLLFIASVLALLIGVPLETHGSDSENHKDGEHSAEELVTASEEHEHAAEHKDDKSHEEHEDEKGHEEEVDDPVQKLEDEKGHNEEAEDHVQEHEDEKEHDEDADDHVEKHEDETGHKEVAEDRVQAHKQDADDDDERSATISSSINIEEPPSSDISEEKREEEDKEQKTTVKIEKRKRTCCLLNLREPSSPCSCSQWLKEALRRSVFFRPLLRLARDFLASRTERPGDDLGLLERLPDPRQLGFFNAGLGSGYYGGYPGFGGGYPGYYGYPGMGWATTPGFGSGTYL